MKNYEQMSSEARARTLNGVAFTNTCKKSDMDSLIKTFTMVIDGLSDPSTITTSAVIAEMEDTIEKLLTSLQNSACSKLAVQVSADATQTKNSFTVNTDQCVTATTDSCCYRGLSFTSACSKRAVTVNTISYANSPTANSNCKTPRSVESQVAKLVQVRTDKCLSSFQDQFDTANAMIDRYSAIFDPLFSDDKWIACSANGDCPSGKCNTVSGYCTPVSTDLSEYEAIGDYLKHSLGNDLSKLLSILDVSDDATSQQIGQQFQTAITSQQCIDSHGNPVTSQEKASKAACESTTVCNNINLSNTACTGAGFCGAKCSNYCKAVVTANQADCAGGVLCTNTQTGVPSFAANAASCKSSGSGTCSVTCSGCTETSCKAATQCSSNYYSELDQYLGKCLIPFTVSKTGERTCPDGSLGYVNPLGCVTGVAKTSCTGLFLDPGSDCSSINLCERKDPLLGVIVSTQSESGCVSSGGSMVPAFSLKRGTWIPSNAAESGALSWKTPALVKKNQWVTALDEKLLSGMIYSLVQNIFNRALKDFLSCSVNPILQTARITSCDCSTDKNSKESCFDSGLVVDKAAFSSSSFRDVPVDFSRVSMLVPRGSPSAVVSLTEFLMSAPSPRKEVKKVPVATIPVRNKYQATVGQIVGDGYSINQSIANTKLCIAVDPTVKIDDSGYVSSAFATRGADGKYSLASVKIENDKEVNPSAICGFISDTKVYYPAAVVIEADTRKGDASMTGYSMIATVLVLVLGLLVISKQQ